MYDTLLEKSQRSIDAVKRHILLSNGIRTLIIQKQISCAKDGAPCFDLSQFYINAPDPTDWRIIDHCSAVTRLYAIFEQYVHEVLREYLIFIETNIDYANLDPRLQTEHRRALGQVLVNLDKERFRTLRFESIIADVAGAFSKGHGYRLLPEAMLAHDQNLRMAELANLFSRCGVSNIQEWVLKHRALKEFFGRETRQSDKADSELKQLVDYRNDAAHGGIGVDSVLGAEILTEYADFLGALCSALAECVQSSVLDKSVELQKIRLSGKVNKVYSRNIVVAIVENATFSIGDAVYFKGPAFCYQGKILSIQDDGASLGTKTVLAPIELGFQFDVEPRVAAEMYRIG